jgi:hypothetical protein
MDAADARNAIVSWLRLYIGVVRTYRGVPESVMATIDDATSELHAACTAMRGAVGDLLDRAQRLGRVRRDVTSADLLSLGASLAWVAEHGTADGERLLEVVVDGLAATAAER